MFMVIVISKGDAVGKVMATGIKDKKTADRIANIYNKTREKDEMILVEGVELQ